MVCRLTDVASSVCDFRRPRRNSAGFIGSNSLSTHRIAAELPLSIVDIHPSERHQIFDGSIGSDTMLVVSQTDFPIDALCRDNTAMAMIVGTEGPSYRSPGATMAVVETGERIGSLSSGCIERDVGIHSREALQTGRVRQLRYGRGSPWTDIELPCGGGLDILILPRPDRSVLNWAAKELLARSSVMLAIDAINGVLKRHADPGDLALTILPELRFVVFGKGLEGRTFAETANLIGYRVEFFSPDQEALRAGQLANRYMSAPRWPTDLPIDGRTAITLFFHDQSRN
ncbi:XdhC family protein [Rhizobium mongolense]|uniref:XdhC family protein n=1 Tax=Rhizobium mongolense TaxID=57676 RepID=UPI0034A38707